MDVYEIITSKIIAELEKGKIPWQKPWITVGDHAPRKYVNGKPYSLLNQFLLWKPGEYITMKQIQKENEKMQKKNNDFKTIFCKVKKGESPQIVVGWIPKEVPHTKSEMEYAEEHGITLKKKTIPIPKYYYVFHIDQCEGIQSKLAQPILPDCVESNEKADSIMNNYIDREKITLIYEKGDQAYYRPKTDTIVLPVKEQFKNTTEFYGTAFHEMTHSTGHKNRLNRIEKKAAFGNEEYSKEELVAEIGSATLVNQCGLDTEHSTRNNAAYIQSWLRVLKDDKKFIFSAASQAEKAIKYILGEKVNEESVVSEVE